MCLVRSPHRDELWTQCYDDLMGQFRTRLGQEMIRLGGDDRDEPTRGASRFHPHDCQPFSARSDWESLGSRQFLRKVPIVWPDEHSTSGSRYENSSRG